MHKWRRCEGTLHARIPNINEWLPRVHPINLLVVMVVQPLMIRVGKGIWYALHKTELPRDPVRVAPLDVGHVHHGGGSCPAQVHSGLWVMLRR